METGDDWRTRFRPDIPSPARIYDYFLGGKDNYPADREAAEEIRATVPSIRMFAAENRAFLRRAVHYLAAEAGVRQFLDIGTGLPTQGNVHEIAQAAAPGARVVYVDNDPVVLSHGRALLHGVDGAVIISQDLRQPAAILHHPQTTQLIDFRRPVALLLVAVLHFVSDADHPAALISELMSALAPGSYLVISHGTVDARPESALALKVFERATAQAYARNRDEVAALAAGLDLVEPGLVWAPQWRPRDEVATDPADSHLYALVARKPG